MLNQLEPIRTHYHRIDFNWFTTHCLPGVIDQLGHLSLGQIQTQKVSIPSFSEIEENQWYQNNS